MAKFKHLTILNRVEIQSCLDRGFRFYEIAKQLNKDPTTIAKEVKKHLIRKETGCGGQAYNPCVYVPRCYEVKICGVRNCFTRKSCPSCGKCITVCPRYLEYKCPKLSRPPYCCNGCSGLKGCRLTKYFYKASEAHEQYMRHLSESRQGSLITPAEVERICDLMYPLILKGQSVHHIIATHKDEIMLIERTVYSYIDSNVLNIKNIDLPRKVRYRQRKVEKILKIDKFCREGRTYDDYLVFIEKNDYPAVVQMDSVKGDMSGKVLLTIHFVSTSFMLAFLRDANTAKSVADVFNYLYSLLGRERFIKLFPVILTDNGSEFSDPTKIEFDENGERRTYIFYCDRNRSNQKGNIEVNHEFIRRISPKGVSFDSRTQDDINLMMSHINSYKRKRLNDQSPFSAFSLFYGKDIPRLLGIKEIEPDSIVLTTKLFKK